MTMTSPGASSKVTPFEWLTSPSSLDHVILSALNVDGSDRHEDKQGTTVDISLQPQPRRVLHVGSGSSTLGEHLLLDPRFNISHVVNIDRDKETNDRMKQRWDQLCSDKDANLGLGFEISLMAQKKRLDFVTIDFESIAIAGGPNESPDTSEVSFDYPDGYFDLVIDKSTLDCTLCSEYATATLLALTHRLLRPDGGVYLVISFHHMDLLKPILEECPGVDWKISHCLIERQVEDLIAPRQPDTGPTRDEPKHQSSASASDWNTHDASSEGYRRFVNVLQCRRYSQLSDPEGKSHRLDLELVNRHVHAVNDQWYQTHNPMLTNDRRERISKEFYFADLNGIQVKRQRSLEDCYNILFTDAEREHLTYDLFLEDWEAFLDTENDSTLLQPHDCMSLDTAFKFLEAMQ